MRSNITTNQARAKLTKGSLRPGAKKALTSLRNYGKGVIRRVANKVFK